MHNRMLIDTNLDNQLDKDGYVVIPFLNSTEVKRLTELYLQYNPDVKEGLYATSNAEGFEQKQMFSDEIKKQFKRAIDETFFESNPLGGSYIVKYKGEAGVLFPHQDWGIVDEDKFCSYNIWVPLVDTNDLNGAISVLPGTHKMLKSYRGLNIPDPFYLCNAHAWKLHRTLHMKAGEALIYDHRILHASTVNQTEVPRIAVVFGIVSNKADLRYYYRNGDVVEEYESNVDFFFDNDFREGPKSLLKLRDIEYDFPVISDEEFDRLYQALQQSSHPKTLNRSVVEQDGWVNKLRRVIGI